MIKTFERIFNIKYAKFIKERRADKFAQFSDQPTRAEIRVNKVAALKKNSIRLIVGFLFIVLVFPMFSKNMLGQKIMIKKEDEIAADKASQTENIPVMLQPKFFGRDSEDRPFNLNATSAVNVSKEKLVLNYIDGKMALKNGSTLSLKSSQGDYFVESKEVSLTGGVEMNIDESYNFETNTAYIKFAENLATGSDKVNIKGIMGDITSNGFNISNSGEEIQLFGGVELNATISKVKDLEIKNSF